MRQADASERSELHAADPDLLYPRTGRIGHRPDALRQGGFQGQQLRIDRIVGHELLQVIRVRALDAARDALYLLFPEEPGNDGRPDRVRHRAVEQEIDAALDADRRIYLHCRAGIGRTGLVIGCWLARHGDSGDVALEHLNELWTGSKLAGTWLRVPETEQQAKYVRTWRERRASPGPAVAPGTAGLPVAQQRLPTPLPEQP